MKRRSISALSRIISAWFGTAPIEKDLHVVRAIRAETSIDASPFTLVLGGGTALARAHKYRPPHVRGCRFQDRAAACDVSLRRGPSGVSRSPP